MIINLTQKGMINSFANTRKGYWNTAKSPITCRTLTNARLYDAGYLFFTDYYGKVKV